MGANEVKHNNPKMEDYYITWRVIERDSSGNERVPSKSEYNLKKLFAEIRRQYKNYADKDIKERANICIYPHENRVTFVVDDDYSNEIALSECCK